jgi:mannonate dehydratase
MEGVGTKVLDLIEYFGKRKKIFYVHFRNVRGTFPKYDEVFIDEGDVPMLEALKAYRDSGFDGVIIPDHVPVLNTVSEPWRNGMSYSVGYIKAAMQALNII